ncbi:hypothetical protein Psi02_54740 [Planotetraspora silvatica]|uniref:DUF3592 domain-containing protein n=1 Tax=Planotetraspora silvatica TaxID=234614 RepID=A0A8J3V309_9ACTN|nr:hypothetical protein Psi02_54740 [Planotetraspora silvatica]
MKNLSRAGWRAFLRAGTASNSTSSFPRRRYDDDENTVRHSPVIEFSTEDGQVVRARSPRESTEPFVVGSTVPILYDPGAPKVVKITSGQGSGSAGGPRLVVGILGLATTWIIAWDFISQKL